MQSSGVDGFPPELLFSICTHVYTAGLPSSEPSLDPLALLDCGIPTSLPSSLTSTNWQEPVSRKTLANLCLVNRSWYEAAKPWLWRRIEVRLPRAWLALVDQISGAEDEETGEEQTAIVLGRTIREAENALLASKAVLGEAPYHEAAKRLHETIMESISWPGGSIPPELLSPPASRDPSPRRLRAKSKSPVRWKLMRSISAAVQTVLGRGKLDVYVSVPANPLPGRYIRHLDFNHFRTIGMRRSVEEGVNSRFVTGDRVEAVLKELPNLTTFGATEYMDGALTLPVLKELFLRGGPSRGRGRLSRGHTVTDSCDSDEEDRERMRDFRELEAVDLTGCVSAVFVNALTDFVNMHLLQSTGSESRHNHFEESPSRDRTSRTSVGERLTLAGLQRLGLLGAKSIPASILHPFVLACPSLTHLDLSCTRVTPDLLASLATTHSLRLQSLSLGRCVRLTGESIRAFLVDSPAASQISELGLYGDGTFPSPLSPGELQDILRHAPCFTSGKLQYLDLSSAPLTKELLLESFPAQPQLRSLGLSHIPDLELDAVAEFLKAKASNVEVLTMVSTSPELGYGQMRVSVRAASLALHTRLIRPICTAPVSFRLTGPCGVGAPVPTKLRVIELTPSLLNGLGAGAGSWRIVRSKGGRGWYADVASGWVTSLSDDGLWRGGVSDMLRRDLEKSHPLRMEMEKLADANGNVNSGVGWHARKMEILHGQGLLGREDGLYGAVSFAYQG